VVVVNEGAHAGTDVTGFGLFGHSNNLAKNQKQKLHFEIHTVPVIKTMKFIDDSLNNKYQLLKGLAAETSGFVFIFP
jgi:selenide,water dikinase